MIAYLEPSALFKCYWEEEGSENVEWVLAQLDEHNKGETSIWTLLEITRGFIKRANLGEISYDEAGDAINFFLADMRDLERKKKIKIVGITKGIVNRALVIMRERNLYAADSMHVATASNTNADAMLVDDRHFEKFYEIEGVKVLNVADDAFRDLFAEIKGRAKKF